MHSLLPHKYSCHKRRNSCDSQIVRMLNEVSLASKEGKEVDLCPASKEKEIDAMNEFVYEKVISSGRRHFDGDF